MDHSDFSCGKEKVMPSSSTAGVSLEDFPPFSGGRGGSSSSRSAATALSSSFVADPPSVPAQSSS